MVKELGSSQYSYVLYSYKLIVLLSVNTVFKGSVSKVLLFEGLLTHCSRAVY